MLPYFHPQILFQCKCRRGTGLNPLFMLQSIFDKGKNAGRSIKMLNLRFTSFKSEMSMCLQLYKNHQSFKLKSRVD